METRVLELRRNVLNKNDELARALRGQFQNAGTLVMNLVSSPGTGKTEFLKKTLTELQHRGLRVAALVGDLETENDAQRLGASGAPVRQIMTHGCCHLDASMIERNMDGWSLDAIDVLFIENVGNLVCPSNYDLGEAVRVALLSVTEGEDKPLKYPGIFNSADVVVITKMDIAEACEFDLALAETNLHEVRPGVEIFRVSSKRGDGMESWFDFVVAQQQCTAASRMATAAPLA